MIFFIGNFLVNAAFSVFQSPLIIAMETSSEASHAHITMMQYIGWSVGMSIVPLLSWALGNWFHIIMVTTLPCLVGLALYK